MKRTAPRAPVRRRTAKANVRVKPVVTKPRQSKLTDWKKIEGMVEVIKSNNPKYSTIRKRDMVKRLIVLTKIGLTQQEPIDAFNALEHVYNNDRGGFFRRNPNIRKAVEAVLEKEVVE